MSYDAANRITTIQDDPTRVTMVYDNNGNLTQEQRGAVNTDFGYDRENRMSAVSISAGLPRSCTYDLDG